jgi:hypothetical protein
MYPDVAGSGFGNPSYIKKRNNIRTFFPAGAGTCNHRSAGRIQA